MIDYIKRWPSSLTLAAGLMVILLSLPACSGQDRAPPEVPGVEIERLTQEELSLYRRVLTNELSPCGGRVTLEEALRRGDCPLAPLAARFVAFRVEQDDTYEEIAERYLSRYGASEHQDLDVEGAPILGEPDAPVTLVVFSDFNCPHCARAGEQLRSMIEESQGRVRLAYRNFPLLRHRGSMEAAVAGLAAHRQERFWALHDAMFENRARLNEEVILALAEQVGLDVEQFRQDLLDPALEARVRAEREEGEQLGVRGTPTVFVNGRQHMAPLARLPFAIEEALARVEVNRSNGETSQPRTSSQSEGGNDDEEE